MAVKGPIYRGVQNLLAPPRIAFFVTSRGRSAFGVRRRVSEAFPLYPLIH
jgi:hypothetical protein